MTKQQRVLLYGNSIILGTLVVSLRQYSDLIMITLTPPFPETQELQALAPDVIIFDLQAAQPEAAFTLLETCPDLMLIGIDPGSEQVFLWTGKHMKALSAQDLAKSIRIHASASEEEDHELKSM
jgi:hypothetical protein